MYYDYDEEQIRKQLKRRYNRKFFLAAHFVVLTMTLLITFALPSLRIIVILMGLALIPHIIYVAYYEYHRWLEGRIERELYQAEQPPYMTEKRKRDHHDAVDEARFRLTDDGEIVEVPAAYEDTAQRHRSERDTYDRKERKPAAYREEKRYSEYKSRKREKKRRKDDTDEFDVKKLLKKLKDIVD